MYPGVLFYECIDSLSIIATFPVNILVHVDKGIGIQSFGLGPQVRSITVVFVLLFTS